MAPVRYPRYLALSLAVLLLAAVPARGEPEETKGGPKGATYSNKELGVRAEGPEGWKLVADDGSAPSRWRRLATFNDTATDAQAVLSVRPRDAGSLDALMTRVRAEWQKSAPRLRMDGIRKVEASAVSRVPYVAVDGSFTRKPKPKPAEKGVPAPPSAGVSYRVEATYFLGAGYEYLLYAQGRQTHWSRLRTPLRRLRESVKLADVAADAAAAAGSGMYRNDHLGFSCTYPRDYAIVVPQREHHVVQFEGVSAEDPVLGIYHFKWSESAEKDAERVIAHYEENEGGTAEMKRYEVAGQEGVLVTAKATLGGVDRVILLAIVKRGDWCFRLRGVVPAAKAAEGARVFRTFAGSLKLKRRSG